MRTPNQGFLTSQIGRVVLSAEQRFNWIRYWHFDLRLELWVSIVIDRTKAAVGLHQMGINIQLWLRLDLGLSLVLWVLWILWVIVLLVVL